MIPVKVIERINLSRDAITCLHDQKRQEKHHEKHHEKHQEKQVRINESCKSILNPSTLVVGGHLSSTSHLKSSEN